MMRGGGAVLLTAKWESFDELKQTAKRVAKKAFDDGLTDEQIEAVYNVFYPSGDVSDSRKLAVMYKNYLLGKVSEEEAKKCTAEALERYEDRNTWHEKFIAWQTAASKALQESGKEFGGGEFVCPICNCQAWYSRNFTPRNIAHSVTIRGYCKGCNYSIMN